MRRPSNTRLATLRPQLRRVLALAHARELSPEQGAVLAGLSVSRFRHLLSCLRSQGLASTVTVHRPERLGRPLHVRTLVRLETLDKRVRADFEQACAEDPWVAWAAAVTGRHHYLLVGHHRDLRARNAWLRLLASRPGVGAVESEILDVRFGHMLSGAVIAEAADIRGARRRREARS